MRLFCTPALLYKPEKAASESLGDQVTDFAGAHLSLGFVEFWIASRLGLYRRSCSHRPRQLLLHRGQLRGVRCSMRHESWEDAGSSHHGTRIHASAFVERHRSQWPTEPALRFRAARPGTIDCGLAQAIFVSTVTLRGRHDLQPLFLHRHSVHGLLNSNQLAR